MKRCGCCGEVKPVSEFHKSRNKPGGLSNRCKNCQSELRRKWQKDNAEAISKVNAAYHSLNRKADNARVRMRSKEFLKRSRKAEIRKLEEFYRNRPEGHHVDHVIPLVGKVNGEHVVCGLHVLANLQYLPAHDNDSKGSKVQFSQVNELTGV